MVRVAKEMRPRVLLLGSTRLTRVATHWLLEEARAEVVGIDPGEEDETRPWFAPVRQLARDNGIPLGRATADLVLDLDPDARPDRGEGVMVRVVPPPAAKSPDINRALLVEGDWSMAVTDSSGRTAWTVLPVPVRAGDDASLLLHRATAVGLEALAAAFPSVLEGSTAFPLPTPLRPGRWRPQESFVLWEQRAPQVVARIRAASGPWGGARTHLGDTVVWLEDAEVASLEANPDFPPGTILAAENELLVSSGAGSVRIGLLRPAYRPVRRAVDYVGEVGVSVGYQFA